MDRTSGEPGSTSDDAAAEVASPAWRYELCRVAREHDTITETVLEHVEDGWLYAGEEPVGGTFVDIVFRRPNHEHGPDHPLARRGLFRRSMVL